jgi:UrcA family protein
MKTFLAIASAAALVALGAGPAAAQDSVQVRTAVVSYADLDLKSEGGRKALDRRIRQAVDRVCPARPHISQLQLNKVYTACRDFAWTGARQQLAAIYGGQVLADASVLVSGGAD